MISSTKREIEQRRDIDLAEGRQTVALGVTPHLRNSGARTL